MQVAGPIRFFFFWRHDTRYPKCWARQIRWVSSTAFAGPFPSISMHNLSSCCCFAGGQLSPAELNTILSPSSTCSCSPLAKQWTPHWERDSAFTSCFACSSKRHSIVLGCCLKLASMTPVTMYVTCRHTSRACFSVLVWSTTISPLSSKHSGPSRICRCARWSFPAKRCMQAERMRIARDCNRRTGPKWTAWVVCGWWMLAGHRSAALQSYWYSICYATTRNCCALIVVSTLMAMPPCRAW